jgi:hypothetical protein
MHSSENAEPVLKRALGHFYLITLGIGAIIGSRISVLTGHAPAQFSGPAVVFSFATAGLGCFFAGLCYRQAIATYLFMMVFMPLDTWLRLAAWTAIDLVIYYLYSVKHAAPLRYAFAGR